MLLEESSLASLISLSSLAEECMWSLEVVWTWEVIEDSLVKSSRSSVWVTCSEYVVNEDFGSSGINGFLLEFDISLWGWGSEDFFENVVW